MAADVTGVGRIWCWCGHGGFLLPQLPFCVSVWSQRSFVCLQPVSESLLPFVSVLGSGQPTCLLPDSSSAHSVFWHAAIVHSTNVAQPAETLLLQHGEHSGKLFSQQDCTVRVPVLPGDSQYTSQTTQMEGVSPPLLVCVKSPGFAAILECSDNAGSVHLYLCVNGDLAVLP